MIYIFTITVLLCFIFKYDLTGYQDSNSYNKLYTMTMIWFICISGFAYNVGSDIVAYMTEYDYASWSKMPSFREMLVNNERRMPLWTILVTLCRSVSSNFVVLKLVIAAFCNWSFFRFIKKHSQYPFVSVLLYAVILYLHMNFNALRQMVSVAIFLLGYDYLTNKKWVAYYLTVVVAYLFHSSALICFLFPLVTLIKINVKTTILIGAAALVLSVYFYMSDINALLRGFFFKYGGEMSADIQEAVNTYLTDDSVSGLNLNGLISILFSTIFYSLILYMSIETYSDNGKMIDTQFYVIFLLFFALNITIPIVFFRFLFYVQFFYIVVCPTGVLNILRLFNLKTPIITFLVLSFVIYAPIRQLLAENKASGIPLIYQYYPYYSVFNPEIDPLRKSMFGSHK